MSQNNSANHWRLSFVGIKVHVFAVNDCVRISDNIHQVKEMQKSHGEWTENMKTVSYWLLIAAFNVLYS